MPVLVALIAAVVLASPFGTATADVIDVSRGGMTVEVTVEASDDATAIIARPFSDYEELPATALVRGADGTWIGWVELPTPQNWHIAFEAFEPEGESTISEGVTLLELGVDPAVIVSEVLGPLPAKPLLPAGAGWLIAGVLLMVAALAALAFWTFGLSGDDEPADEDEEVEVT